MYVHINKTNGKRYVGITSKPRVEQRWSNGNGYCESPHFASAIEKYGWDGFDHVVLFYGLDEKHAKRMEEYYIEVWRTQDNRFGYNMTSGGDGTPGYHPSEETRKKLSVARRKENLSSETLARRSLGLKGRKFTESHKEKIGKANSKKVNMYDLSDRLIKQFPSMKIAEDETGVNHSHISQCCKNQRQSAGGYHWKYAQ